jgi:hypothetical protein
VPPCVAVVDERIDVLVGQRPDTAATPAIAAIGAAEGDELFAPEAHAPGPAVSGGHIDQGFVDELHGR